MDSFNPAKGEFKLPDGLTKADLDGLSEEDLDALLGDLEPLTKDSPLDYTPHAKQLRLHNSPKRIRLMVGGNRSGKTEWGCMEAVFHATGIYPSWYPKDLRLYKHNRGRIIVESFGVGQEVLEPKLFRWLPASLIVNIKRTHNGYLQKLVILHKSGKTSTIEIMTHEQDDAVFEGWSGHWAWFDEPPPYDKFSATWRGLVDFGGRCWLSFTPIKEPWIYDKFIEGNGKDGEEFIKLIEYVSVDIRDNPNLTEQYVRDFEVSLSEEDKEARINGKFRHLTGRVYKDLDRDVHVVDGQNIKMDSRWPVYFVLDPADRRPHHGIWFRVDPLGVMWVFDEIVEKGTIEQISKKILQREIMAKINPLAVIRILDPNKGETPSNVTGLRLKEEFAKWAIYFITSVNDKVDLGHLAVSERLKWDKSKPLSLSNRPTLYFLKDGTKECVKQLFSYVWDDWRGNAKDSKSAKEKPKDINKDMPDCVRYGVVFNPQFFLPEDNVESSTSFNSSTGYGH